MKNEIAIAGLVSKKKYSYSHTDKRGNEDRFYELSVEVPRLSENVDVLQVIVPEKLLNDADVNELVTVRGEIRSRNFKDANNGSHLSVYILADNMEVITTEEFDNIQIKNQVKIEGYLCRTPVYRETKTSRYITSLMVKHNKESLIDGHQYRASYIPCITWGPNAKAAKKLQVNDHVIIDGRFQSRKYRRQTENFENDYVTYEVSVFHYEVIPEEDTNTAYVEKEIA